MKSKIIFLIILWLKLSLAFSQSIDSLLMFTNNNEGLFWDIVSKNYPLSQDEIEKYGENLNFYYISGNENLEWNANFIEKYENLLSKTYELQRNKGINWDEELITKFINRDWFDWSQLYYNRELKISNRLFEQQKHNFITTKFIVAEDIDSTTFQYNNPYTQQNRLFENYLKNWYSKSDSIRVKNYEILKKYLEKTISSIPIDTIVKYNKDFNWLDLTPYANIDWSWRNFKSYILTLKKDIYLTIENCSMIYLNHC